MVAKLLRFKNLGFVGIALVVGWVGWSTYVYFFDISTPVVTVAGLTEGGFYAGDMQCSVTSSKKGDLSVWLDGQPLLNKFRMSSRQAEHPFTIPTRSIANGQHNLKIEFCDATFGHHKVELERTFNVDNVRLQAAFVKPEADYKVFQGRTLHIQFQVNKPIKEAKVQALSHAYPCFPETPQSSVYECFIPIACEENPNEYLFSVQLADNVGNTLNLENKFQIVVYPFKTQIVQLTQEKVQEARATGRSISEREKILEELALKSPQEKLWRGAFCTPVDITRVTCDYGTVRTTQEKGRYKHKALDVLSTPKSVIWSTQDGVVVLKDRFEDAGNTVVVDHGCGILSMFYHLDNFANIQVGQKIAQGSPIGTLGKTGYATGYHLHWEMRVNNIAVDPMQWTKPTF
jgi:hypothetical protein